MKSVIWIPSKEKFQEIVKSKNSLADILRHFNLHTGAGNYKTLKRRIEKENIDISHIALGLNSRQGKVDQFIRVSIEEYFGRKKLHGTDKTKILKSGMLGNVCSECGLGQVWNNKPLRLQIDHIDGDDSNNKKENLRLLCPNCHTQTDTYAGKRHKKKYSCIDCGAGIGKTSLRCLICSGRFNNQSSKKPSKEELERLIKTHNNFSKLGRMLGVSDNAVRKWAKSYKLI